MKNDRTLQIINYWRSSLADASRINIKLEEIESAERIDRTEIKAGQISPDLAREISGSSQKHPVIKEVEKPLPIYPAKKIQRFPSRSPPMF